MKVPGILATRAHASGTANTLLDAETAEENGGAESGAVAEASSSRTVGNCSADQRDSNDIQLVDVGGVAGGAKAVHKALGLFLKTPDDSHGIYGSMVMAAKVMKLEVNANRYIHGMDSIHVSAPLSTIVDVPCKNCGGDYVQRVQVQALLPVGPETLRVGSSDGGVTMHQDAEQDDVVEAVSMRFHLAPAQQRRCERIVRHSYRQDDDQLDEGPVSGIDDGASSADRDISNQ